MPAGPQVMPGGPEKVRMVGRLYALGGEGADEAERSDAADGAGGRETIRS